MESAEVRLLREDAGGKTEITIKCGRSSWHVNPYRASVVCSISPIGELDNPPQLFIFESCARLVEWLDAFIDGKLKEKFQITRYKVNGVPIDWFCCIDLPKVDPKTTCPWFRSGQDVHNA